MRSGEVDILIVPGWTGSGPDHWQTRWQARLTTARRVEQDDWEKPDAARWTQAVVEAASRATRPVVFVAHSLGVHAVVRAAPLLAGKNVAGAFLVAPPSARAIRDRPAIDPAFADIPTAPLPFPGVLVLSRTDPYCPYEQGLDMAHDWGMSPTDAGESGHINSLSGHGPWPEGLMRFAGFLKGLRVA